MTDNPREALFHQLEARFDSLKARFEQLDAEVDARIVRWRYALDSAFELRADYFPRFNQKPGSLLDDEPTQAYLYHAYGFDAQNRLIYAATFQTEELPRVCAFYEHGEDRIDFAEFQHELYTEKFHLVKVGRLVQSPSQSPVYYDEYAQAEGQAGLFSEEYHYDERGRLARILSTTRKQPRPLSPEAEQRWQQAIEQQRQMARLFGTEKQFEETMLPMMQGAFQQQGTYHTEERYEYEGDTLKRIVSRFGEASGDFSQSPPRTLYEAPRTGETPEGLYEAARSALRELISERIRQFGAADARRTRFFNLLLTYDAVADDGLMLTFGTQARREAWERNGDGEGYGAMVFYGDPFSDRARSIELWELPEDFERFVRDQRREQGWNTIRDLIARVCLDLNERDWSGVLNTTDDFIIFAWDHEALPDVEDEIRACVPPEKISLLEEEGWM
jgi:hypothetical protein